MTTNPNSEAQAEQTDHPKLFRYVKIHNVDNFRRLMDSFGMIENEDYFIIDH